MSNAVPFFLLFIFSFFLFPTSSSSRSTSPSIASKQLMFWSNNVLNEMPEHLVPKLSPLTVTESARFASLLSEGSSIANTGFCSRANLACHTNLSHVRGTYEGYGYEEEIISSHFEKVDKHSFFRLSKLKEGNEIYVPNARDNYPSRAFLPYEIGSKISINKMELQKMFPQSFIFEITREAIQATISYCNVPVLKGEIKSCSSSLEGMINFAKDALGQRHLLALTSKSLNHSVAELMIERIERFNAKRIVSCHDVFLPFSTYFCHVLSSTHLYAVDVVDPNARTAAKTAFAICHMDTSTWPRNHVSFKILNSSPGKGEACHWMTHIDLVFVSGKQK